MASLQQTLNTLDYKCWYYETALKAGTTDVLQNMPIEDIPEQFQEVRQNLTHGSHAYHASFSKIRKNPSEAGFPDGFLYIYIFIYLRLTSNFFASALVSRLMPRTIISRTTAIPNATPNSPLVALR